MMRHAMKPTLPALLGLLLLPQISLAQSSPSTSGWYLRAGLGYEKSRDADFFDHHCEARTPPALFGCGSGDNGQSLGARGDFGNARALELGIGKRLLPWLRGEVSLTYRAGLDYHGDSNFLGVGQPQPVRGELKTWNAMVNVFADLDRLAGLDTGIFSPYVGLSLGLARHELDPLDFRFPANPGRHKYSTMPGGKHTHFAHGYSVGTGIRLSSRTHLDLALRYQDLGKVSSGAGTLKMNHLPAGIPIDRIDSRLKTYGIMLGLRYEL